MLQQSWKAYLLQVTDLPPLLRRNEQGNNLLRRCILEGDVSDELMLKPWLVLSFAGLMLAGDSTADWILWFEPS